MNYKLVKRKSKEWVMEKETEMLFGPFESREKAREQMRFFNMGGAFDGYTPSFIKNGDRNEN